MTERILNPEQINANITAQLPTRKLTNPPSIGTIATSNPEHAYYLSIIENAVDILRPMTPQEKARVQRWINFFEKTYWMWIDDTMPQISKEELEEWKAKAQFKLQQMSQLWTAFAEFVGSEETKDAVEKLSDTIIKLGAAIVYLTAMISGKMMVKYKPEVRLAINSAGLIFQQSLNNFIQGAISTGAGPLATVPAMLFTGAQALGRVAAAIAAGNRAIGDLGFTTATAFDKMTKPAMNIIQQAQEAVDTIQKLVPTTIDTSEYSQDELDNVNKIETDILSIPKKRPDNIDIPNPTQNTSPLTNPIIADNTNIKKGGRKKTFKKRKRKKKRKSVKRKRKSRKSKRN